VSDHPAEPRASARDEDLAAIGETIPAWRLGLARFLFRGDERVEFYQTLAAYLERSIRLTEALPEIRELEIEGRSPWLHWTSPLAAAIPHWLYRILDHGDGFDKVMADWLPAEEAMIFASISQAGLTGENLRELAAISEKQTKWKKALRRALSPLVGVSVLFIAAFWQLSTSLFPRLFEALPSGTELEGSALALKDASDFFAAYGPFVMVLTILAPLGLARLLPRWTGTARAYCEGLPLFALYRRWTGLGFLLSLSALLKAGSSLIDALELLRDRAQPYVAERLSGVLSFDYLPLGDAMASTKFDWPDRRTIKLIRHSIVSDRPGSALAQLAATATDRLDRDLERLSGWISMGAQIAVFGALAWFLQATNQLSDLMQTGSIPNQ
jgi:type II secretory pathway component PulF